MPVSASTWQSRARAALCHLGISAAIATGILLLVYLGWYRTPLDRLCGVGEILILLLTVDVALGPLLTFIVFNRAKKSLRFDLGCIAGLQIAALAYGLHAVEAGRPHFLVFVKDRFEVVSLADLRPEDWAAAGGNAEARRDWFGPRVVAAVTPSDPKLREQILFESVEGGRDLQQLPVLYRDYASQRAAALARSLPVDLLREFNRQRAGEVDTHLLASGRPEFQLRFLPVKGPRGDGSMLIDASSGAVVALVDLAPWAQ